MIHLKLKARDVGMPVDQWALFNETKDGYIHCILLGTGKVVKVVQSSVCGMRLTENFSLNFTVTGYDVAEGSLAKDQDIYARLETLEEAVRILTEAQRRDDDT